MQPQYLQGGPANMPVLSNMGNPKFPVLSEIASFGQAGIQWKGYALNAVAGSNPVNISQPGNMRMLVGATLFGLPTPPTNESVSLNINSNLVLDNIPALAICPQGPNGHVNNGMAFFPIYRTLNGNDSIIATITGQATASYTLVLYYLPG